MSLARNVYEHAIQQVGGGATPDSINIDELLPATMTEAWYTEYRNRLSTGSRRSWETTPDLMEYYDSFQNRNRRDRYHAAAAIMARNSSRNLDDYAVSRRLGNHRTLAGLDVAQDEHGNGAVVMFYEHDNPMDAPTLLGDAPEGVVVCWSYDEITHDESYDRVHDESLGNMYVANAEKAELLQSWAETLGLEEAFSPDQHLIGWVAPDEWTYCPNLSKRFVLFNLSCTSRVWLQHLFSTGAVKAPVSPPETGEYTTDQIAEAEDIVNLVSGVRTQINDIRRRSQTRLTDARNVVQNTRDAIENYRRRHAEQLASMREHVAELDAAEVAANNVDYSQLLNRFDVVAELNDIPSIMSAQLTRQGHIGFRTYPLNLRGYESAYTCVDCRNENRAEPSPECDGCERSGQITRSIGTLTFTINPSTFVTSVANDDGARYPHPHVSGTEPCWGAAGVSINESLERCDYVSAVHMMLGWASTYSAESPYRPLGDYPPADSGEPHGFVIPEDSE